MIATGNISSSIKVAALYSLYPPLRIDSKASIKLYREFSKYFAIARTASIRGTFLHNGETLRVALRSCTIAHKKRYFRKAPFLRVGDPVLQFSATFNFPGEDKFFWTDHTGANVMATKEEKISTWKSHFPLDLELTVQSYLAALMIAFPGAVRPTGNVWLLDGSTYRVGHYFVSQLFESIEFLREKNAFPKIRVSVDKVIRWVFSQNGIFDGYSDSPASRALNYYTRLFTSDFRNDELSDLVWALAGIESLLVEGGRSSVGQLREKLLAIFGSKMDSCWLSKMVTDSYNFRSRMIHGDRQIRSSFREDEERSQKRFDEEYDSQLFAIGILVLLLRFAISKDLDRIRFKTTIDRRETD